MLNELVQPSAVRACSSICGLRASVTERLHREDGSFSVAPDARNIRVTAPLDVCA
jgi:hypothetical protein